MCDVCLSALLLVCVCVCVSVGRLANQHFEHHRDVELEELRVSLAGLGLRGPLLAQCVDAIGAKDETLLKFMMAFEFGHTEADERNPLVAMAFSGALFVAGSIPSIIPFFFIGDKQSDISVGTLVAGILCLLALFAVGSIKCIVTKANWVYGGCENMVLGAIGAGVSYGIGAIYDVITKK